MSHRRSFSLPRDNTGVPIMAFSYDERVVTTANDSTPVTEELPHNAGILEVAVVTAAAHFSLHGASEVVANASGPSGAFTAAEADDSGPQTLTIKLDTDITIVDIAVTGEGDEVISASDLDDALVTAAAEAAGFSFSGTFAGEDFTVHRADGESFDIDFDSTFAGESGAFAGTDWAEGTTNEVDNGAPMEPLSEATDEDSIFPAGSVHLVKITNGAKYFSVLAVSGSPVVSVSGVM